MYVNASRTWSLLPLPDVVNINVFISVLCLGAHSHIRGLGLDDALEPRQVVISLKFIVCSCGTCSLLSWHLTPKEMYLEYDSVRKSCLLEFQCMSSNCSV